jgi:MGT family glycosyltransferase
MATFLFLPVPAYGHVNPTMAVAAELVARGHRVVYLLPEEFRGAVAYTGATVVPFAASPGRSATRFTLSGLLDLTTLAVESLLAVHAEIEPDVVATEPMAVWGNMLIQARDQPSVMLSPSYAFRAGSAQALRLARPTADAIADPRVPIRYCEVGRLFGLELHQLAGRPSGPTVAFMPREFHPGQDQLADDVRFVGPSLPRPEPNGPPPGDDVLYISLGTLFNEQPAFFRACVDAFGGRGRPPVVISHGAHVTAGDIGPVPDNVVLAPSVSQLAVLARSRVFVTHGGMNSTMEAMASDVPLVVVPQMIEQEVTADRVVELDLGRRVDAADITAERLAAVVKDVVHDATVHAAVRRMGRACRSAGGPQAAATVLEAAVGQVGGVSA